MNAFSIGLSALGSGNRALEIIGQNISNASTPGYHRQAVQLTSQWLEGGRPAGVDVANITRYSAPPLRTAILRGNAEYAAALSRLDVHRKAETALPTGTNGIDGHLEQFFNQIEALTTRPEDTSARRPLLATASNLASQFNLAADNLDTLSTDLSQQIRGSVDEVNGLATRIADLNARIARANSQGFTANDLLDQRDQLIDDLSQRIDVRTVNQPNGIVNVLTTDSPIVVGDSATTFEVGTDSSGAITIMETGTDRRVSFASGTLGGLIQSHNVDMPAMRSRLDGLAREFVRQVNQVQATGLSSNGLMTQLRGTQRVADPSATLDSLNLPFAPRAGALSISVTNAATGERTTSRIDIDPAAQSLQDVAAAITTGTGGQVLATVDPDTNSLNLQAQEGYAFDFAGQSTGSSTATTASDPDSGGLLSALGVNGLFTGDSASTIALRPDVESDPNLLAMSRTNAAGDATNLERFAALRDRPIFGGSRTFTDEFTDTVARVGTEVNSLDVQQSAQSGILADLKAQEQSVTGVDVNEELVHLLNYQRMMESASRYMALVNSTLDSVMQMLN